MKNEECPMKNKKLGRKLTYCHSREGGNLDRNKKHHLVILDLFQNPSGLEPSRRVLPPVLERLWRGARLSRRAGASGLEAGSETEQEAKSWTKHVLNLIGDSG